MLLVRLMDLAVMIHPPIQESYIYMQAGDRQAGSFLCSPSA